MESHVERPPLPEPAPDCVLRVTVQANDGMSVVPFAVDGHEVVLPCVGTHMVPIRSGRRSLRASSRFLWRFGGAGMELDAAPGQTIDVFYAPPYVRLAAGTMGLTPQRRKGLTALVIGLVVIAVPVLGSTAALMVLVVRQLLS